MLNKGKTHTHTNTHIHTRTQTRATGYVAGVVTLLTELEICHTTALDDAAKNDRQKETHTRHAEERWSGSVNGG